MLLLLLMKSKHRFCIMDSDAPAALSLSPQLTTSSWDEQVLAFHLAQPKPDIELVCHSCGEPVRWRRCKSTKNNTENRWMAIVSAQ
jgi:hypothetical protein